MCNLTFLPPPLGDYAAGTTWQQPIRSKRIRFTGGLVKTHSAATLQQSADANRLKTYKKNTCVVLWELANSRKTALLFFLRSPAVDRNDRSSHVVILCDTDMHPRNEIAYSRRRATLSPDDARVGDSDHVRAAPHPRVLNKSSPLHRCPTRVPRTVHHVSRRKLLFAFLYNTDPLYEQTL